MTNKAFVTPSPAKNSVHLSGGHSESELFMTAQNDGARHTRTVSQRQGINYMFKTASEATNLYRRNSARRSKNNIRTLQTDPSKMSSARNLNVEEEVFDSLVQPSEKILSTHFNQDCSCLAISTNFGFKVFSLLHPQKVVKLYENKDLGVVSLIAMQFRSNIIAVVTRSQNLENLYTEVDRKSNYNTQGYNSTR